MGKGYLTVREAAAKLNVTTRLITIYCAQGRIEGARKQGKIWLVPENAELPPDMRVTIGHYKGYKSRIRVKKDLTEALDEFHSLGSVSESVMEDILEKYSLVNKK